MTREEKEQTGKYVLEMARLLEDGCYQQEMLLKAVHIINEALEQESVLDKIRAEIEELPTKKCTETHMVYIDAYNFKKNVLTIFDKYKAESEG